MWGDGNQTRSFLFVDECVEAVLKLMQSDYKFPVNIGSEEMVSMNQLAEMVIGISGKDLTIKNIFGDEFIEKYGHKCPLGVKGRNSDNKLYREVVGWEVSQPLKLGIEITYNWIKDLVSKNKKCDYCGKESYSKFVTNTWTEIGDKIQCLTCRLTN
jgi:nucleoside-diphosphate-sugar epimerase